MSSVSVGSHSKPWAVRKVLAVGRMIVREVDRELDLREHEGGDGPVVVGLGSRQQKYIAPGIPQLVAEVQSHFQWARATFQSGPDGVKIVLSKVQ